MIRERRQLVLTSVYEVLARRAILDTHRLPSGYPEDQYARSPSDTPNLCSRRHRRYIQMSTDQRAPRYTILDSGRCNTRVVRLWSNRHEREICGGRRLSHSPGLDMSSTC